jgi:tripartite-type tricarboxylate transporter receptor subunit TctC
VIASPADGATLLYTPSSLSLTVAVNKVAPYDVARDQTPIVNVAISPYALVANPSVPATDLKELIGYAKANPGKLSYSSAGIGSASHLAAELFKLDAGIDMVHVPNKGMNPALIDLIGGSVQVLFASVPGMQAERAHVRAIAMAERKRSALMPELATMDEQGLKGFEVANWAGLLGPAGLDPAIVKKLHSQIIEILATPDMKERIKTLGYDVLASPPEEFGAQIKNDVPHARICAAPSAAMTIRRSGCRNSPSALTRIDPATPAEGSWSRSPPSAQLVWIAAFFTTSLQRATSCTAWAPNSSGVLAITS